MGKIIKKVFLFLVIFLIIFSFFQIQANSPKNILKKLPAVLNSNPQNLTYQVKFFGVFPLALAQINFMGEEPYEKRKAYKIAAVAKTFDFMKNLFYANAKVESWVDKERLYALKFSQSSNINGKEGRDKDKTIYYNQDEHTMLYRNEKRIIMPNTQDPLSAIFYIRNQQLAVGKDFDIYFNTNKHNYLMKTKVLDKKIYSLGGVNFSIWEIGAEIRRSNGSPYHQTNLKFFLLDNETKTLLLIKVFSGIGIISVPLVAAN